MTEHQRRDEVCECECFQSDHAAQSILGVSVAGHGRCLRCGECSQYTFERFAGPVPVEERA